MPSSPPPGSKCCTTTATRARASSSPTRSGSASHTGWWWPSGASGRVSGTIATGATAPAPSSRSPRRSPSCARGLRAERASRAARRRALPAIALAVLAAALPHPAHADQQLDPQLREVIAKAIGEAECFTDHYDSAVWYTLMEPRLRRIVKEKNQRLDILREVYCETHRAGEARLPPGLVMALIDVESRFARWAVSPSGAVGLMQVMPFWPERRGASRPRPRKSRRRGAVPRAAPSSRHARA